MVADGALLPPVGYNPLWVVLGVLLLLGLLIWLLTVYVVTARAEDGEAPLPPEAVVLARRRALAAIDDVEARVAREELSARRGHHELSRIVRTFAAEVSGLDAERMTATDLRSRGPAHLADLIVEYYPRQFGAAESQAGSVAESAGRAREVVTGWR